MQDVQVARQDRLDKMGQGEVTISTGNRNFAGKQGNGSVYLASPEVVAASAIAGYITTPDDIPAKPSLFIAPEKPAEFEKKVKRHKGKDDNRICHRRKSMAHSKG